MVLSVLSGVELSSCDLLREGAPIEPVPAVTHWKPDAVVREASAVSCPCSGRCPPLVSKRSPKCTLEPAAAV